MKCSKCGAELPEGELLCPVCGETKKKNKKGLMMLACVVAACTALSAVWFATQNQKPALSMEEAAEQRSMLAYNDKQGIHVLLPENQQSVPMYLNNAKDLTSHQLFSEMLSQTLSGGSTYMGPENFARLGSEVLYLQSCFNSYDSGSQAVVADYILYSFQNGESVEIDRGVQGITCASDRSIYYVKNENNMTVQYRYSEGQVTAVTDLIEADFAMVTFCSDDDSVLGFATAEFSADGSSYTARNGYLSDGEAHFFDNTLTEVYFVSPDGAHIYVVDMPEGGGRAVTLSYITDQAKGELLEVAQSVSEVSFYEDSGEVTCIGQAVIDDLVANPVGQVIHFDPQSKSAQLIADAAVALVESVNKGYSWLNEHSNEMVVTEQSNLSVIPALVQKGQFHFIREDGSFCAADANGNVFEIAAEFYVPESYMYGEGLYYLTEKDGAFYWAQGDQVYRYIVGSMKAPEKVALDNDLVSKIESGLEIGYTLSGDGSVLEQSGNTFNLKPFGQPSSTLYDSTDGLYVIGLSTTGDKLYLMSMDSQVLEKEINSEKEPQIIAENVHDAVAVENGLYILKDHGEHGGTLLHMDFAKGKMTEVANEVLGISDIVIQ